MCSEASLAASRVTASRAKTPARRARPTLSRPCATACLRPSAALPPYATAAGSPHVRNTELATAYPNAGSDYHFRNRAYGRGVSFLFSWARFSVITKGSIALLGFVFGDHISAELKDEHHNMVRALIWSIVLITVLYRLVLGVCGAILAVLPRHEQARWIESAAAVEHATVLQGRAYPRVRFPPD